MKELVRAKLLEDRAEFDRRRLSLIDELNAVCGAIQYQDRLLSWLESGETGSSANQADSPSVDET